MDDYPNLSYWLGAYVHQDWPDEYDDDVWGALEDLLSVDRHRASGLVDDITSLLASELTDAEVGAEISRLGGCYQVDDGSSYRSWLAEVARRVRLSTQETPPV